METLSRSFFVSIYHKARTLPSGKILLLYCSIVLPILFALQASYHNTCTWCQRCNPKSWQKRRRSCFRIGPLDHWTCVGPNICSHRPYASTLPSTAVVTNSAGYLFLAENHVQVYPFLAIAILNDDPCYRSSTAGTSTSVNFANINQRIIHTIDL